MATCEALQQVRTLSSRHLQRLQRRCDAHRPAAIVPRDFVSVEKSARLEEEMFLYLVVDDDYFQWPFFNGEF